MNENKGNKNILFMSNCRVIMAITLIKSIPVTKTITITMRVTKT